MINDLNRWTVGWIDWNLLLDDRGGPNHVGNFCSAPMLVDTAAGRIHAAELVLLPRPLRALHAARRAARALCRDHGKTSRPTAFVNPDGSAAVVALNRTEQTRRFALRIVGSRIVTELPPRSIASYVVPEETWNRPALMRRRHQGGTRCVREPTQLNLIGPTFSPFA